MGLYPYDTNVYDKYIHGSFNIDNEIYYYFKHNITLHQFCKTNYCKAQNQNEYSKLNVQCFWTNHTIYTIILDPKVPQRGSL
jgi:hypothetical protein